MAIRGPSAKGLDCVSGARVRIPLSPLYYIEESSHHQVIGSFFCIGMRTLDRVRRSIISVRDTSQSRPEGEYPSLSVEHYIEESSHHQVIGSFFA